MKKLVECIPNFSTSDKKILKKIVEQIEQIPKVQILDINLDKDHNRSVITFIGESENVIGAMFRAVRTATKLIDLKKHKGVHPRIGTTDVIPLVPIKGITYKECIKLARKLGKQIGEKLKIPIYLYEKATTSPERKNLANIRKKGYIQSHKPDFGPSNPKSTNATAIGVRNFLIAFNINLKSNDLEIAKKIAKKLRKLPSTKALGLPLKSRKIVQISMNLTNYKKTSPLKAFKTVQKEARRSGIEILESELIGLAPKNSMPHNPKSTLLLKTLKTHQLTDFKKL